MTDLDKPAEPLREQYERLTREMQYMMSLASMAGWREGVENCASLAETTAKQYRDEMTTLDPMSGPYATAYVAAQAMEKMATALRLRMHEVADPVRPEVVS